MFESKSSLGIAILAQFRKLKKVSPILVSASHLLPDANAVILRSEPSSRTAFMGEQPNPWDVLPPQDAMSRHRGAKPPRRCELLGEISLLSLE